MKRLLQPLFLALACHCVFAANDNYPVGFRMVGLGNAAVTLTDHWMVFNNIAGIAALTNVNVGAAYERRYNFSGFSMAAISANIPLVFKSTQAGNAGMGFYRFGDELYNETRLNAGWAHKIAGVSIGIQVEYLQVSIQDIGTRSNIAVNFGGQAHITKTLVFGASIYNINQAKIADYEDERIPTIMKAGLSYRPIETLLLNVEMEKDVEMKPKYKAGVEFAIIEYIVLRTGMNINPQAQFFGCSFKNKTWDIGYALSLHSQLGAAHTFGLNYKFISSRKKTAPSGS